MDEFEDMDAWLLQRALELVRLHTGIHMASGKQTMLQARLRPRLRSLQLAGYGAYLKRLSEDSHEHQSFIEAVTTHETSFFRTKRVWRYIIDDFLPQWHTANPGGKLRVWSAAASTGEEICTMAMCCEEARRNGLAIDYEIVGTDISLDVLAVAEVGNYSGTAVATFLKSSPDLFHRYNAASTDGHFRLADAVRQRLRFSPYNLMDECPWKGEFDVVLIRNVLIYFNAGHIGPIVRGAAAGMLEGGLLVIGESESLSGHDTPFEFVGPQIYRQKLPRDQRHLHPGPLPAERGQSFAMPNEPPDRHLQRQLAST